MPSITGIKRISDGSYPIKTHGYVAVDDESTGQGHILLQDLLSNIAPEFRTDVACEVGKAYWNPADGKLYRCKTAHSGAWVAGHFERVSLEELKQTLAHLLPTTATEADLVSGNYFALDGSAGTKKLPGDCIALKSGLDNLKNLSTTSGYYVLTGTTVPSKTASAGYQSTIIDTSAGQKFKIAGRGSSSARLWATFNTNGTIVRRANANEDTTSSPVTITIESGEVGIVFNTIVSVGYDRYISYEKNSDEIAGLSKNENGIMDYLNPLKVINYFSIGQTQNIVKILDGEASLSGITCEKKSIGILNLSGTANKDGGRTVKLTELMSLEPCKYFVSIFPLNVASKTASVVAYIEDDQDTIITSASLSNITTSIKINFTLGQSEDVYIGFNVTNGVNYDGISYALMICKNEDFEQFIPTSGYIDFVSRESLKIENDVKLVSGGYIDYPNGTELGDVLFPVLTSSSAYSNAVVSVKKGDHFVLTGTGAVTARLWVLVDADFKIVNFSGSSEVKRDYLLKIERDGYLYVNVRNANERSLKYVKVSTDFERSLARMSRFPLSRNYFVGYANAEEKLLFKNVYGSSQSVHPKVVYVPAGFAGHRYWMAYTPYPYGNSLYENPCIAFSDDGFMWEDISGNPIDDEDVDGITKYNSDTHLLIKNGTLECWYRYVSAGVGEYIYRKTSSNGVDWSERELVMQMLGNQTAKLLSPVVWWDSTRSVYCMWVVDNIDDYKIKYYESAYNNGFSWTLVQTIEIPISYDGKQYNPWHIDVEKIDSQYVMLIMAKEKNSGTSWPLFISTSEDNETYSAPFIVMVGNDSGWDAQLYRACLTKIDNLVRVYYSARNGSVYGIGVSEFFSKWKLFGCNAML